VGPRKPEDGFSLIEPMTVVLVIVVLLAIAIPVLQEGKNVVGVQSLFRQVLLGS